MDLLKLKTRNSWIRASSNRKFGSNLNLSFQIPGPFFFATDLDGTLVPNDAKAPPDMAQIRQLLQHLREAGCPICYATGRNLPMARQVVSEYGLIEPDWWICNLGSEIYDRNERTLREWNSRTALHPLRQSTMRLLEDLRDLTLQETDRQGPGKLSYYCNRSDSVSVKNDVKKRLTANLQGLRVVTSIDGTTGTTLVDVISDRAGKARAIFFVAAGCGFQPNRIYYAGNSGNDQDVLLSGIRSTLVGNASSSFRKTIQSKAKSLTNTNVYLARACYGRGIIEGMNAHGFENPETWRFGFCE